MPFTPIHMGPALLVKPILAGNFSIMIFGWTQIVIDLQPLYVLLTGEGQLHGITHTYLGAIVIAIFSAVTGKYLSELAFKITKPIHHSTVSVIKWRIVFTSAFIGSMSHVFLDSTMHFDMAPFYPFSTYNGLLGVISLKSLHLLCLYSGLLGVCVYGILKLRTMSSLK
ncbi:metal-dependent hydrolase [Pseudoalteromonas aurantia]|uniref:Hydrolase n=1 Tax=Pseudoalteromonas aurantia TaxID=43654 RepID=A0A5S3VE81_9GAMM|nr:metal-dependent hydrolase [Pseudoalteromonas aurantia]TMO56565.1 hypothetical protein CWC18_19255 [Pseudoalteromonas aurantia]TMO70584.1 hypothetical protein CWC19_00525 [Pseudoalteromonas aurantia]TMO73509.1 hypothetical protein CWC20_12965 [Pseudoalteromonas aurantia]